MDSFTELFDQVVEDSCDDACDDCVVEAFDVAYTYGHEKGYDEGYDDGYADGLAAGTSSGARQALDNVQAMVAAEVYAVDGDLAEELPFDYASVEEEFGFAPEDIEDDLDLGAIFVLWFIEINQVVDQLLSAGQRFAAELDDLFAAVEWNFGEFAEAHNMLVDEVEQLREHQDADAVVIESQADQIADIRQELADMRKVLYLD